MEIWEVIGIDTKCMLTIKADGNKQVHGQKLYLVGDVPAEHSGRFHGRICREQFLSNERLGALNVSLQPGDVIQIFFNRYGDIAKIDIVK